MMPNGILIMEPVILKLSAVVGDVESAVEVGLVRAGKMRRSAFEGRLLMVASLKVGMCRL